MKNAKPSMGVVALVVVIAVLCAGLGWAARTLLTPPQPEEQAADYAIGHTTQGSLGRQLSLAAKAEWVAQSSLAGRIAGTLTSIPGGRQGTVSAGDVLYTVDLQPVFVLPGQIPAFRDMATGVEGQDVAQLQAYLFDTYGWALEPDGKFGQATQTLVKQWQKDHDLEATGAIPAGQVLFAPSLPMNLVWEDDVRVGSDLQAGTKLVKVFGATPTFTMPLPEGQLRAAREGQEVTLEHEGHTWQALIDTIEENTEERTLIAQLAPIAGRDSICEDQCHSIPPTGLKGITASVVLIPQEEGTQVPINAIRVNAQGQTVIVDEAGTQHPVTVRTSVGGQAIVDGIAPGVKIRVWGGGQPADTSSQQPGSQEGQSGDHNSQSGR